MHTRPLHALCGQSLMLDRPGLEEVQCKLPHNADNLAPTTECTDAAIKCQAAQARRELHAQHPPKSERMNH